MAMVFSMLAFVVFISHAAATTTKTQPNVLFMLFDDWGFGDVNINSPNVTTSAADVHTPTLARLANTGKFFVDFHTASPVCSPSRCGLMTSRYPARYKIHTALNVNPEANQKLGCTNFLPLDAPFLPRIMQANGYVTGHFGKWHLGATSDAPGVNSYGYNASVTFNSNSNKSAQIPKDLDCQGCWSSYFVNETISFIQNATAAKQPFYVNLWTHVSHAVLDPTPEQLLATPFEQFCRDAATNQTKCARQIFRAAQRDTDAQIGRLLDAIDTLKLRTNTLIVLVAGDNGPEDENVYLNGRGVTGPFRGRKRSLYEGGHRIAMFASYLGVIPSAFPEGEVYVEHSTVGAVDLAPTILSLAGLDIPPELSDGMDGEDRSAVFTAKPGPILPKQKQLYWEWRYGVAGNCWNAAPLLAMREGSLKFLMHPDGSRKELYNLSTSLFEHQNLATISGYEDTVAAMSKQLLAFKATLPVGPETPQPDCTAKFTGVEPSMASFSGKKVIYHDSREHDTEWPSDHAVLV